MKTWENKYVEWLQDENSTDIYSKRNGFKAGYELAKKEFEEQLKELKVWEKTAIFHSERNEELKLELKEARKVIEAFSECNYPDDINSQCDILIDEAKAYLEKWK